MANFSSFLFFFLTAVAGSSTAQDSYYKEVYPTVNFSQDLSGHVFFALVQSFGKEFNGSGNIAGIKVALDRINSDPNILPDHTLHYTLTDSKASDIGQLAMYSCIHTGLCSAKDQ